MLVPEEAITSRQNIGAKPLQNRGASTNSTNSNRKGQWNVRRKRILMSCAVSVGKGYIGSVSKALALVALVLLSLFLVSTGNNPAFSQAKETMASALASTSQAPQPRDLTFYMHNSTIAKDVNGVSTPYIFDTFQAFGGNDTVTKLQEVKQDWYLFPPLAGNLTVNGTMTLHAFASVSLVNSQITPTLTVSEINSTGDTNWSLSQNYGSVSWWADPHDLVLTMSDVHHTFSAGSTILVLLDIVSGSRIVTIWYNSSWVPTHLIIQSDDFAQVDSIAFLDYDGVPRVNFDPLAANTTIQIVVNVTDPLGGYDIQWVNLTIDRPGGGYELVNAPMTKTAGNPLSWISTYQLWWNYSGEPVGRYNATVSVLDNSGLYYFEEFFATDGFLSQLDAYFFIGGLPVYVNVKAIDSEGYVLPDATVVLKSGNVAVDSRATDAYGMANMTMAKGIYTFEITWQGILVASQAQNVTDNVTASDPLAISCQVYYPIFQAQDAAGASLAGASLLFIHPNSQKIGPYKTNESGFVELLQVPVGTYHLTATWRGVDVFQGNESVTSNGVISFKTAVYELTVTAKAGNGKVLAGVFISVVDSEGLVYDAGMTNSNGTVVLRLPAGDYTLKSQYITSYRGSYYDSGVRTMPLSLVNSTSVTVTITGFPISFTRTLDFMFALVYAITVAVLLIALYLVWRGKRRGGGTPQTPPSEQKT